MDFMNEDDAMDHAVNEKKSSRSMESDYNSNAYISSLQSASTSQILTQDISENNLLNASPLSTSSNGNATEMHSNDSGDAEGVWSPDIDQAFHEALQIYPPCGRRKIILSDEGKMYGRNELIARYIKIRCGKTRTRKQVSSHIQVLARKKQREEQSRLKSQKENNYTGPSTLIHSNTELNNDSSSTSLPILKKESSNSKPVSTLILDHEFIGTSASDDLNSHNTTLAVQRPINFLTKEQIASMRAQVLKAASAMPTIGGSNDWSCSLMANNLLGNFIQPETQLYATNSTDIMKTNNDRYLQSSNINGQSEKNIPSTSLNNLTIASSKLVLKEYTAYIEQNLKNVGMEGNRIEIVHINTSIISSEKITLDLIQAKYPPILQELFKKGPKNAFFLSKCWTSMNFDIADKQNTLFAVDSYYEASEKFDIVVSTKVCSFGNEVVEKVEIYSPIDDDEQRNVRGIWNFKLEKSPMCEYMVRFILELKKLHEPSLMNSVLENFTVLQIVTEKITGETLMVIAFVFEVRDDGEDEIYTNTYRLIES